MSTERKRYCAYCRVFRDDIGFKLIRHRETGSSRYQCQSCQDIRRLPPQERDRLARLDAEARAKAASDFQKGLIADRRKKKAL